jgi:hypothetical protein
MFCSILVTFGIEKQYDYIFSKVANISHLEQQHQGYKLYYQKMMEDLCIQLCRIPSSQPVLQLGLQNSCIVAG